jgi:Flp pilus assembly protein TadD
LHLDCALSLRTTNADNHHNRGNALYATSRHPEAVAAFTTALTLQPTDTESYFNLGNAFDKMGHARDAAGAFRTVLRLAPNDAAAACNLACMQVLTTAPCIPTGAAPRTERRGCGLQPGQCSEGGR